MAEYSPPINSRLFSKSHFFASQSCGLQNGDHRPVAFMPVRVHRANETRNFTYRIAFLPHDKNDSKHKDAKWRGKPEKKHERTTTRTLLQRLTTARCTTKNADRRLLLEFMEFVRIVSFFPIFRSLSLAPTFVRGSFFTFFFPPLSRRRVFFFYRRRTFVREFGLPNERSDRFCGDWFVVLVRTLEKRN